MTKAITYLLAALLTFAVASQGSGSRGWHLRAATMTSEVNVAQKVANKGKPGKGKVEPSGVETFVYVRGPSGELQRKRLGAPTAAESIDPTPRRLALASLVNLLTGEQVDPKDPLRAVAKTLVRARISGALDSPDGDSTWTGDSIFSAEEWDQWLNGQRVQEDWPLPAEGMRAWIPGPAQSRHLLLAEIRQACALAEATQDDEFIEGLAKKAQTYLAKHNASLTDDRVKAARRLRRYVAGEIEQLDCKSRADAGRIAYAIILDILLFAAEWNAALRINMKANPNGAWVGVRGALESLFESGDARNFNRSSRKPDPEAVIRVALKSLGHPDGLVKNFFSGNV